MSRLPPSLCVARLSHHYYLHNAANGRLKAPEVVELSQLNANPEALWPSLLRDQ